MSAPSAIPENTIPAEPLPPTTAPEPVAMPTPETPVKGSGSKLIRIVVILGVIILLFIILVLILVMQAGNSANNNVQPTPTSTTTPTPTLAIETTTPTATPTVYENSFMKVTVPADWTYTTTSTGAINMIKGKYILYINPNTTQASGINGGRFAEVASGAPSADAVVTEQPHDPCGTSETSPAFLTYIRNDLYVNNTETTGGCSSPSDGSTVWYFSYVNAGSGYLNYYTNNPPQSWVITMAYKATNVNNLPKKGAADLNKMLTEMTNIIKTLQLKHT